MACLNAFLGGTRWQDGVSALVTTVNQLLGGHRVALAWRDGRSMRLRALSEGVPLNEGVALGPLHEAIESCVTQAALVVWPRRSTAATAREGLQVSAHAALLSIQGLTGVATLPLMVGGQVCGVLSCERSARADGALGQDGLWLDEGFSEAEQEWLRTLAGWLAPAMALRYRLEQPWYARSWTWLETLSVRLADPRERTLRWSVLAFFGVLSFGLGLPLPYEVSVAARLEGASELVLSAPVEGLVQEARAHVGDVVKTGQVLARVEDRQHDRLDVKAPYDGVVITAALSRHLGQRVPRGEPLLTVAPGLDWRVVMDVPESLVMALQKGQMAHLRLGAMPERTVGLVLTRVSPVARHTPAGVVYEVEGVPTGAGAGARDLRPGLDGVARIDMPARPLLWRAVERAWTALRAWAWASL